jgi:hypothetical protein
MRRFDLAGRATLSVAGPQEVEKYVEDQLDPFRAVTGGGEAADVELRPADESELPPPRELHRAAGDGLVTGFDGDRLQLVAGHRRCAVPDAMAGAPSSFAYEPGFPVARAFKPFVRTALQLAMLRRRAVAVHSAAVEIDGGAVLVAGWSESGKTETALALVERGARFLSDKWTVVGDDGMASAFPIDVGVRGWVLRYLPRLRRSLPPRARFQLAAARLAAVPAERLLAGKPTGRPEHLLRAYERGAALADRAPVTVTRVRAAYGQSDDPARLVPLRAVALLTTVPQGPPAIQDVDARWAALRLARSAAYERRPYFSLAERALYAEPDSAREDLPQLVLEREAELLEPLLGRTTVLEVLAPFPTDPRTVAGALEAWL